MSALGSAPATHTHLSGLSTGLIGAGILGLFVAGLFGGARDAWTGVLVMTAIPVSLGIGSLVFLAVHLAANAVWIAPYRRILTMGGFGTLMGIFGFLALGCGGGAYVYEWFATAGTPDHAHIFHSDDGTKAGWMMPGRWVITGLIIFALWAIILYALKLISNKKGEQLQPALTRWGVVALILILPSFTIFAWDTLLSLNTMFVSTMWGFYCLVGGMQAALAALILMVLMLAQGKNAQLAKPHLLHDLGTWLLGGSCIVTYITYAQWAIIDYANIPEETHFLIMRKQWGFYEMYILEALLRFSPFFILMSQSLRTNVRALTLAAILVLIGFLIDMTWIIIPGVNRNGLAEPIIWIAHGLVLLGGLGLWLLPAAVSLRRAPVSPDADPRTAMAINAEHLH